MKLITNKFIIITGLTRCGKTLISAIISSLKKCEQFFFSTSSENISSLNFLGKINKKIASDLIIRFFNQEVLNKYYGRNLNNKKNDYTSINFYRGEVDYKKRVKLLKKKINLKNLKKNFFPVMFHEGLINLSLLEKSLNRPKIINISRHPIDIINSWLKKKYVRSYFMRPQSEVITYTYKNHEIPFFCYGVENLYINCKSNEDHIVLMLYNLKRIFKNNYRKSNFKNNIILLNFDNFVTNPVENLDQICKQFRLNFSKKTKKTIISLNCPRIISYKDRLKNQRKIFLKLSFSLKNILSKMINDYETKKLNF